MADNSKQVRDEIDKIVWSFRDLYPKFCPLCAEGTPITEQPQWGIYVHGDKACLAARWKELAWLTLDARNHCLPE